MAYSNLETRAPIDSLEKQMVGGSTSASSMKESDHLLDHQEKQLQYMVETMSRLEKLADRFHGAQPAGLDQGGANKPASEYAGVFGGLMQQNMDRDAALGRMNEAINRLERFI